MSSQLIPLPSRQDNYIWVLMDAHRQCLVVDPGEAAPVLTFLQDQDATLGAILITHHHHDHVGGLPELLERFPVPVLGPGNESIPGRTRAVGDNEVLELTAPSLLLRVLAVPGHTLGHLAYYCDSISPPVLFCGDTLFASGCGRLFEGTPLQMWTSLTRLAALPDQTRICCAHEYSLANVHFARTLLPDDPHLQAREERMQAQRRQGLPTLPVSLEEERRCNPFLRAAEQTVATAVARAQQVPVSSGPVETFAALRAWKDRF